MAPGKYQMKIWSDRSVKPVVQEITIKAGKNTIKATVDGDAPEGAQPSKFGKSRAS
ncbi:MAG: hypothetical protein R2939_13485 [Kofleriaceae bacterium]